MTEIRSIASPRWVVALLLSLQCVLAGAQESGPVAGPEAGMAALAARERALSHALRCVVCQNQSLAESNADVAVDLRQQVRQQLQAGRSDEEIVAWVRGRYGDFVLYRPPMRTSTALLWFGPAVFLMLGGWLLGRALRAPSRARAREGGERVAGQEIAAKGGSGGVGDGRTVEDVEGRAGEGGASRQGKAAHRGRA